MGFGDDSRNVGVLHVDIKHYGATAFTLVNRMATYTVEECTSTE